VVQQDSARRMSPRAGARKFDASSPGYFVAGRVSPWGNRHGTEMERPFLPPCIRWTADKLPASSSASISDGAVPPGSALAPCVLPWRWHCRRRCAPLRRSRATRARDAEQKANWRDGCQSAASTSPGRPSPLPPRWTPRGQTLHAVTRPVRTADLATAVANSRSSRTPGARTARTTAP